MSIDFATFTTVAPHILDSKLPVLIRGRHGVGKSEVVYQIAAARNLPVVERRASQMTEGDLLGLPDTADTEINGRKATTWNAPDWLVTACEQPVMLFLDEVDRATQEVRQGLFELTDSRKINGWRLHAVPSQSDDGLLRAADRHAFQRTRRLGAEAGFAAWASP
mgnify:CR=1 FL=1